MAPILILTPCAKVGDYLICLQIKTHFYTLLHHYIINSRILQNANINILEDVTNIPFILS